VFLRKYFVLNIFVNFAENIKI
jgi:hypothetical protein